MTRAEVRLRAASESDVRRVVALEAASGGAGNVQSVLLRLRDGSELFCVAHDDAGELVGFVGGALVDSEELSVQSVVVDQKALRPEAAVSMIKQYAARVTTQKVHVRRITVDADAEMAGLFVQAGFSATGVATTKPGEGWKLRLVFDCGRARRISIFQVDAFTSKPYQGNPAAVVLLQPAQFHHERALVWMQNVAREKNLGATAFTTPREGSVDSKTASFDIKWFSPVAELPMCGHGTLSAAVALLDSGRVLPTQTVHFYNKSNELVIRYEPMSDDQFRVVMNFPRKTVGKLPAGTTPDVVAQALGISRADLLDVQLAMNDIIVRVTQSAFTALKPDYIGLAAIDTGRFSVTTEAPLDHSADFLSRFFAPRIGINEDHVTGSAHCGLGPYWSSVLGKCTLTGYQSSSVRGGFVGIELNDTEPDRVLLKCQGIVLSRGMLDIPL